MDIYLDKESMRLRGGNGVEIEHWYTSSVMTYENAGLCRSLEHAIQGIEKNIENRRKSKQEHERGVAEAQRLLAQPFKKQEEYERERALRERKSYADQVSNELRRQEAFDKQKALWERQQQEAQARREQAEEDARIQQRLAREREQWRRELQR